jgi:plasmid stability protein
MAALLIRNMPDEIHAKIRGRAAASGRSLAAEAVFLLADALDDGAGPLPLEQVDALRIRGRKKLGQDLLDRARREGRP